MEVGGRKRGERRSEAADGTFQDTIESFMIDMIDTLTIPRCIDKNYLTLMVGV